MDALVFAIEFHLSRAARRANRNTSAATTATIPRVKRIVFIVLLLSGESMSGRLVGDLELLYFFAVPNVHDRP